MSVKTSTAANTDHATPAYLDTATLLLMAVACGLCAGGNYFNQPLLRSMAVSLQVSESTAALTVTAAQVAYACGLLFIVPLGDKLKRRRLTIGLMLLAALGQFVSGFATDITMLLIGTSIAGLFSVAAQVLVPMAATLSRPQHAGRAVGLVMSGLLTGILLARSIAGLLSGLGGWPTVYRVSGIVMVAIALALWRVLPESHNKQSPSYLHVLASMLTLLRKQPRLRTRSLLGGLSFASVSALFSTMALLLSGPNYQMGDAGIGLIGLVGAAGAMMAGFAGRLADKGRGQTVTTACTAVLLASWGLLWLGNDSLGWFIAGMLFIDLALQGVHISNQAIVYGLEPQARSRVNAVYMTSYFIGGASGSALGALAWHYGDWPATCGLGALLALATAAALWRDQAVARRACARAAQQ